MPPMTMEQIVSVGSLVVAVAMAAMAMRRDSTADRDRQAARAAERRAVADKLDSISDMSRETRDTVREMSRQLQDHSRELARIETRIEEHDRRLDQMESRIGGTD